jgi:hypothetical protein
MLLEWIVLLLCVLCVYTIVPVVRVVPSCGQMSIEYAVLVLGGMIRRIVGVEPVAYALVPLILTAVGYALLQGVLTLLHGGISHSVELAIALVLVVVGYSVVVRLLMSAYGGKRYHIRAFIAGLRMMVRHVLWIIVHVWQHRLVIGFTASMLIVPIFVVPHGGVVASWSAYLFGSVLGVLYGTFFIVAGVCGYLVEE